jgi:crossover junction endonuclease MUS81
VSYIVYFFVRGTGNGNEFMRKQELIDAAEASGLSRVPIAYANSFDLFSDLLSHLFLVVLDSAIDVFETGLVLRPEKGKGKPGQYGSSPKDWYSGWNCMKTLITKGLVVKSSCPAK